MTLPTWDKPQRVWAPYSEPLVVILGDFKKFCQNLQRPITRSTHAFSCKLHRVGPPKTQQQRVHAEPKFGSAHCIFMGKSCIGGEQHRRGRRYFSVRWTMVEQFITMHINIFPQSLHFPAADPCTLQSSPRFYASLECTLGNPYCVNLQPTVISECSPEFNLEMQSGTHTYCTSSAADFII